MLMADTMFINSWTIYTQQQSPGAALETFYFPQAMQDNFIPNINTPSLEKQTWIYHTPIYGGTIRNRVILQV